jgi:hypothetical protein
MHKIAISPAALERMTRRMGKLHPFDSMTPGKTALLVIDMQNYFVKPGHQGEPGCGGAAAMSSGSATAPGIREKAGRPCTKT